MQQRDVAAHPPILRRCRPPDHRHPAPPAPSAPQSAGPVPATSCMPAVCAGRPSGGCSWTSCRGPTATSPAPSSSSGAAERPLHHPVDRLPDARCAGGAGPGPARPRARWSGGVPRPARRRSTVTCTAPGVAAAGTSARPRRRACRSAPGSGRGFRMDLSHLTVSGLCAECAQGSVTIERPGRRLPGRAPPC